MKMKEVIRLVNNGDIEYKFCRFGYVYCGIMEESFTKDELEGNAFGYIRPKGKLFFRKLK